MKYLVSITIGGFINIGKEENEIDSTFEGFENKQAVFTLSDSSRDIITEIGDESYADEFGSTISSISKKLNTLISMIHFNTFFIEYNGAIEDLKQVIKDKIGNNSKATIVEVSNIHTVHFTTLENAMIEHLISK